MMPFGGSGTYFGPKKRWGPTVRSPLTFVPHGSARHDETTTTAATPMTTPSPKPGGGGERDFWKRMIPKQQSAAAVLTEEETRCCRSVKRVNAIRPALPPDWMITSTGVGLSNNFYGRASNSATCIAVDIVATTPDGGRRHGTTLLVALKHVQYVVPVLGGRSTY
jgi:hypothetical protein